MNPGQDLLKTGSYVSLLRLRSSEPNSKHSPRTLGYDVDYWTIKLLRVELAKSGVDYSLKRLYRIVKELGYRLIKPRPKHYKAEEDKWADFKKS
jgi:transposase